MSKPTIDEMLAEVSRWESFYTLKDFSDGKALSQAIRAILEQHREQKDGLTQVLENAIKREAQIEAIRAFVERVEKRSKEYAPKGYLSQQYWHDAVVDELAAMEKEANVEQQLFYNRHMEKKIKDPCDSRKAGCLCGVDGCLITHRLHVHQVIDDVHTVLFTDY